MEKLSEAYILALATVKSELAELKKEYDTVLQQKNVIHDVLIKLKEQRNEIKNKYEILKNETDNTIITLRKEIKDTEIEVKRLQNNIQALEDKSKQSETNKLALQSKLITSYEELNTYKSKVVTCYEELNTSYRELNTYKSKVVTCYEELNTCKSQLMKCNEDLYKKENDLIKLVEQEELLMLRKALTTFEKTNINVEDPTRRAEFWSAYFENVKPKEVLEKVKFNHTNLKDTVRTLFLRMNSKVHEVYPINHEMIIREASVSPDEQKLLRALWQLSPLRKGDLKIVSDKE